MNKKYLDYFNTKGAIRAKANGIYLSTFKMISKIKSLEIYPKTFIDVGANKGMLTKTVNYIFPDCKIYSFEPIKSCFVELKKLEASIKNLKSFNCALSDFNGSADFFESNYNYSSSLLKMSEKHKIAFPHSKGENVYKINVYPIEYFVSDIEIKSPTILKLDVQGAELNVMQGAGKLINYIDFILCEMSLVELYVGQPLLNDVIKYMSQKGFDLIDIIELNRNKVNNELLQIDGLFKKTR